MHLLFAILMTVDPYQPPPVEYEHPPAQEAEPLPYVRQPHLIATVADRGCGPCERWERDTLPALIEAGWEVQVNRVPFGSEVTPSFVFGAKTRRDYGGRKDFMAWLSPATVSLPPGPPVGVTSQPVASAGIVLNPGETLVSIDGKPVGQQAASPMRTALTFRHGMGARWQWPGDLREHLARTHRIDASGMSDAQAIATHDAMHGSR